MADGLVVREHGAGISELRIDNPAAGNRLDERLSREIVASLHHLAGDPSLKVLLLTGRDDVFCAGATQEAIASLLNGTAQLRDLLLLPEQVLAFPLPVIGALRGHAVGGGLILALCCDVLVAADGGRYGANFTAMGFTPGMGATALLPALVGHAFASEMLLTARFYKGRELKGRGMFNHVVPAEQVFELALDLARQMAEKPRHVLEMVKGALALPRRHAVQEAVSREQLMHRICFDRPETAAWIEDSYLG